jgi:D-alanyl-D-alanine carboxypeptidase
MKKMKKPITLCIVTLLFLAGCAPSPSLESRFQSYIDSLYSANPESVGIMVHVEAPTHGISWSGASGFADREARTALEADQPALIASNIKTYVSATILKLVEDGLLSIEQPVRDLLTEKTRALFEEGGYTLDSIQIRHLLSQTGGVQNFANMDYIDFINKNKTHRWTRDEQLELTIKTGPPLAKPGTLFNYSDANYLLLTEIIEHVTEQPFYTAMRELLLYNELGLDHTWFPTLEDMPVGTKPMVHQYWSRYNWDSYDIDVSIDLYGGGGIACPPEELAGFIYKLFNTEIINDTNVLNLIFTEIETQQAPPSPYYMGLWSYDYSGFRGYGHSGFWGTIAIWFPELETSIAVYILEKDKSELRDGIIERYLDLLQ